MKNLYLPLTAALAAVGASTFAQTTKPNIVLIMTDQQRADLCGREGFPMAITPFADSLAHQNVWFDKAYTVAPASAPARCLPGVFLRQPMYAPTIMYPMYITTRIW